MDGISRKLAEADTFFTPWTHEPSGIVSYILRGDSRRPQQTLYFGKPCCDDDFNLLWFAWSTAWAGHAWSGRMLGLVDITRGEMRHFGDLAFNDGSPAVLPATGDILWCNGTGVFRREPLARSRPRFLGALPHEMTRNRFVRRIATQLSLSADGRYAFLDSQVGQRCVMGTLELATRRYEPRFSSPHVFNHAQFSPADPELVLLARDDDTDFTTGHSAPYDHRMFLYRLTGELTPIGPSGREFGHEVWSADGRHIWFMAFRAGVMRVAVQGGEAEMIWPGAGWHVQASECERYVVVDHRVSRPTPGYLVRFLNRDTGKEVEVARMPVMADDSLHRHPHPRFGARDRVITYTTLVHGHADVAVVPVDTLLAATR